MNGEKTLTSEQIREILNDSTSKNNNLLIFFLTFGLYILISTLGTTDIALLLPQHGFKMPVIDFELDLLSFFVLGPLLLLLLHFNILYHHHKHLQKLNKYKNKIDISSIDPLLYNFASDKENHGFEGRISNNILWMLLYILPLLVFLIIYINFSDYHHRVITPIHLGIIIFDLIFINASIIYNNKFYSSKHQNLPTGIFNISARYLFYGIFMSIGLIMIYYFIWFFCPITYQKYDPSYLEEIKDNPYHKKICTVISLLSEHKDCYPRLVVTEEEMAKISPAALYIPRVLAMDGDISDEDKEKKLILKYGTRIDLANRNLRYADLQSSILTRANMRNCQLDAANLMKSHIQAVDLTDANLTDANLMQVKLQSSDLIRTQLQGTNLVRAQMQNTFLNDSNLTNAQMQSTNLFLADFSNAKLSGVNFTGANLTNAKFINSNLTGASFSKANLTSASFQNATLVGTDFTGAHFTKAKMRIPYFKTVPYFGIVPYFKYDKIQGLNLCNIELKEEDFDPGTVPYFKSAQLQGANLYNTEFVDLNDTQIQTSICVKIPKGNKWFNSRKVEYLGDGIKQISSKKQMADDEKDKIISQLQDIQCEAYTKMKERCNNAKEKLDNKNKTEKMSKEDKTNNELYREYVKSLVESYKLTCPVSVAH